MNWPPDYLEVYRWRQAQVFGMRRNKEELKGFREYYRTHPAEFIEHWCDTIDPRRATFDPASGVGKSPARTPFCLFPRQREFVQFLHELIMAQESGLAEKARDMGVTWLCCAFSVWLWLFWPGASVGWGSRKEQLVDKIGDPDSIFEKMRQIVIGLPPDLFWPLGFNRNEHMSYMRFVNPENDATITGEAGNNIGRGGRKLIFFKDEAAHYEHAEMIEASLTNNTNVQVDISSVLGNTVFERKRRAGVEWKPGQGIAKGRTNVFIMDWRSHPEKDQAWYDERLRKAEGDGLGHLFAQEIDRNYAASVQGVIIPSKWLNACVDAHVKLGFDDSGGWGAALDVADGDRPGADKNALTKRKGIILKYAEVWGEIDTGLTAQRAVTGCEGLGPLDLQYDCIGVGSGIKAETNRLKREGTMPRTIRLVPWDAGAAPLDKEKRVVEKDKLSPLIGDFYKNLKAQGWWMLRRRCEMTYRAVMKEPGFTWNTEDLISFPSDLPMLSQILQELGQPTIGKSADFKLLVNKTPDGQPSPNIGDSIMMLYWPMKSHSLNITPEILAATAIPPRFGQRSLPR